VLDGKNKDKVQNPPLITFLSSKRKAKNNITTKVRPCCIVLHGIKELTNKEDTCPIPGLREKD